MPTNYKISLLCLLLFTTAVNSGCKTKNHIDRDEVSVDSLKTLPDNFYAYRRGRVYFEDLKVTNYRIWFNLNASGNIQNIFRIDDFKYKKMNADTIIKMFKIDTVAAKIYAQQFINLSRKYKFGHACIDRENAISFSYKDGLAIQFIRPLNDSIKNAYLANKNFKELANGWFQNIKP